MNHAEEIAIHKEETCIYIAELLTEWAAKGDDFELPDATDAAIVYDQMPLSHSELLGAATFEELVRFAAHDIYRRRERSDTQ